MPNVYAQLEWEIVRLFPQSAGGQDKFESPLAGTLSPYFLFISWGFLGYMAI